MSSYKNISVFHVIINKIFMTNKEIILHGNFPIELISYEKTKFITYTNVEVSNVRDIYQCYETEINDLQNIFIKLNKKEPARYESIMVIIKDLLVNLENLINKCHMITQTRFKQIDFDTLNVVMIKNSILRLVFKMSYLFDKFLEMCENIKIKNYYDGVGSYNWLIYVLNALCNNAFCDCATDKDGIISLETVKFICYSLFQTDEVMSRSNRNIMTRMFT